MVQNIDLAPTFLAMTGQKVPESMQGKSLVPLIRSEKPTDWRTEIYYHYHMQESPGRASHIVARHFGIRTDRYKLINVYDHDFWELYDLKKDPNEVKNLYSDPANQKLVAELKSRLAKLRKNLGETYGPDLN